MNPNKLNHRQREQSASDTRQHAQGEAVREFNTPEELLRHDAASVQPPTEIAARLGESVLRETPPAPWWKRIFGGGRT